MTKISSYNDLLSEGTQSLSSAGITDASIDARLLMEYVFSVDRSFLLAHGRDDILSSNNLEDGEGSKQLVLDRIDKYRELITMRKNHIPLQHLTGVQNFMGIDFCVSDKVLIPRQDTECLVEEAMRYVSDGMRVLDMCTGSGCIIISLCKYKIDLEATAADISMEALKVAQINADRNNADIDFRCGYMFSVIEPDEQFDVIISNPPYIRTADIDKLMEEVRDHEPFIALDGFDDGLYYYNILSVEAMRHLYKGGMIFLEIGYDQGEAVADILKRDGFVSVEVIKDYSGNDRVVLGKKELI